MNNQAIWIGGPVELYRACEPRERVCFNADAGNPKLLAFDEYRAGPAKGVEYDASGVKLEPSDVVPNKMRKRSRGVLRPGRVSQPISAIPMNH